MHEVVFTPKGTRSQVTHEGRRYGSVYAKGVGSLGKRGRDGQLRIERVFGTGLR